MCTFVWHIFFRTTTPYKVVGLLCFKKDVVFSRIMEDEFAGMNLHYPNSVQDHVLQGVGIGAHVAGLCIATYAGYLTSTGVPADDLLYYSMGCCTVGTTLIGTAYAGISEDILFSGLAIGFCVSNLEIIAASTLGESIGHYI